MIICIITLLLDVNPVHGIFHGFNVPDPGTSLIEYPWIIRLAILNQLDENNKVAEYFGGTLITSKYILTVAHPFQDYIKESEVLQR